MSDRWESMLQGWKGQAPVAFLDGCALVGDAVFMAWLWFDAKHPDLKPTPADLIAMARLIVEHHQWLESQST